MRYKYLFRLKQTQNYSKLSCFSSDKPQRVVGVGSSRQRSPLVIISFTRAILTNIINCTPARSTILFVLFAAFSTAPKFELLRTITDCFPQTTAFWKMRFSFPQYNITSTCTDHRNNVHVLYSIRRLCRGGGDYWTSLSWRKSYIRWFFFLFSFDQSVSIVIKCFNYVCKIVSRSYQ